MLNENIFERTFGIIVLGLLIWFIVFMIKNQIKFDKTMQALEKQNPKYKEKIRVFRNKKGFVKGQVFNHLTIKYYIMIFIIIIVLVLVLYSDFRYMINSKIELCIVIVSLISIWIIAKLIIDTPTLEATKYTIQLLNSKYGQILELPVPSKQVIYKEKNEVGNIREVCNFSYYIHMYNCKFENYYYEELRREENIVDDYHNYYYIYVKIKNVFRYYYDLDKIGVSKNIENILQNPKIEEIIRELSDVKFINVYVENQNLIIEKETVLHDYNKNDAYLNVCDIELFYNKLVRAILEIRNI